MKMMPNENNKMLTNNNNNKKSQSNLERGRVTFSLHVTFRRPIPPILPFPLGAEWIPI